MARLFISSPGGENERLALGCREKGSCVAIGGNKLIKTEFYQRCDRIVNLKAIKCD